MKRPRWEVYQDKKKEWRWRFVAKNGKIMTDSGEGYASERKARGAIVRFMNIGGLAFDLDHIEVHK